MKKTIVIFAVFLIAALLTIAACTKHEQPKDHTKNIIILIDYSESVKNSRQDYLNAINKIISTLRDNPLGNHFFVWKITKLSEMESKPLIDDRFESKPGVNDFYTNQNKAKAKKIAYERIKVIEKEIETFLNSNEKLSPKTDILGSLQVSEKVIKSDMKDKSILIIMSDMIEDSSEYNFDRENLIDKRIIAIIEKEKAKKRLPDLNGVKVYVVGAKAPTREQFNNIQNFWLRYFKECGADLTKERYGSALLNFNE